MQGKFMSGIVESQAATRADGGLLNRFTRQNALSLLCHLIAIVGWVLLLPPAGAADADPRHPLAPAIEHAELAAKSLDAVRDYEAVFSKREMVKGKLVAGEMQLKLREEPFSVYMQYIKPNQGREVIFVEGRNKGMLLVHEAGIRSIAGTVSLAPDSDSVLNESRYPADMVGMRKLVGKIIEQWQAETQFGEVDVKFYPDARLGETSCKVIESTHPTPRRQFRFQMTRLYIDKESGLPVRAEQYAFPQQPGGKPQLVEEYTYTRIRTNLGLQDRDFDHTNPNYAFPR